jgi:ATP-dependent Clp protease ATP-binding subunit ClpA
MREMYEQFTDRARKVMHLSNQEAQRFNHEYLGTEHILLGLVKEACGLAAEVLKGLGLDLRKVRLEVEKIVQAGPDMVTPGQKPLTPRAKRVIELAIAESRKLSHTYVGTEHLLLGLLGENEGVAAQVLINLGLSVHTVRQQVLEMLGCDIPSVSQTDKALPFGRSNESESGTQTTPGESNPPDPLTKEARRVIYSSEDEAIRLKHEFIGAEHVLLGLLRQTSGVPLEALEILGVDPAKLRRHLDALLQAGPAQEPGRRRPTPQAQRVLDYAFDEARDLGHNYVGTEHLLLGLLHDQGTTAEVLLSFFGLTLEKVRHEIRRLSPPCSEEDLREQVDEDLSKLPEDVRQAVAEMTAQIERLKFEKEEAVCAQDFEKAAHLLDEVKRIQRQREALFRRYRE